MPWPANGDYYIFKEDSIRAKAPPVSGVYGLYSIKHYVLIGEAADIRETLLYHEKETGFRFGFYRPIGFTFEVCSPELRAERAQQLIAEYRPVLQTGGDFFGLAHYWRELKKARVPKDEPRKDEPRSADAATEASDEDESVPSLQPKSKLFYFSRDQVVILALAFLVTAVGIGFLGVLTGKKIQATRIVRHEESLAKIPVDPAGEPLGSAPAAETEAGPSYFHALTNEPDQPPVTGEPWQQATPPEKTSKPEKTQPKPVEETTAEAPQKPPQVAREKTASPPLRQSERIARGVNREEPLRAWSVQVQSSPDKAAADLWVDRLKTKGYNVFIVEADIKGKTWYRVRVGPFDNRQEAETLRTVLQSKEGFRDAYLTN
jgi:cell division septation protein DedD